jgi:hypothetical protein
MQNPSSMGGESISAGLAYTRFPGFVGALRIAFARGVAVNHPFDSETNQQAKRPLVEEATTTTKMQKCKKQ